MAQNLVSVGGDVKFIIPSGATPIELHSIPIATTNKSFHNITNADYTVTTGKKLQICMGHFIDAGSQDRILTMSYSDDADGTTNQVVIWVSGQSLKPAYQLIKPLFNVATVPAGKYVNIKTDVTSGSQLIDTLWGYEETA